MFSFGRLDAGTALLLECLSGPAPRTILDLGCGSGILGLSSRVLWPSAAVDLVDSSALALEASRLTWEAHGIKPRNLRASDIFSEVKPRYDLILSNPPFHEGPYKDFSFVDRFLRDAKDHLNPGGRLLLVSNRTLPYAKRIRNTFPEVQVLRETPQFKVYQGLAQ